MRAQGNNRKPIFHVDEFRERFLVALGISEVVLRDTTVTAVWVVNRHWMVHRVNASRAIGTVQPSGNPLGPESKEEDVTVYWLTPLT